MNLMPVAVAATAAAVVAVFIARALRLPWWAHLLAAIVSWFGLGLELAIWEVPKGDLAWSALKLAVGPAIAGALYAVVTRGMIGPPEGPLPRSR